MITAAGKVKTGFIRTFTGKLVSPLNLKPEDICIEDIAHHIANSCRFLGASYAFYSVAQHSVGVSRMCDKDWALEGLFHDAEEAYLPDMVRPLKYTTEMKAYRAWGKSAQTIINKALGLRTKHHPSIKEADNRMVATEGLALVRGYENTEGYEPYISAIAPLSPRDSEAEFLARYAELTGKKLFKYILCITNRRQFFDYFIRHNFTDNGLVEKVEHGNTRVYLKTGEILLLASGPDRCQGLDRETTGYITLYCNGDYTGEIDYALEICSRSYRKWTPPIDCKF